MGLYWPRTNHRLVIPSQGAAVLRNAAMDVAWWLENNERGVCHSLGGYFDKMLRDSQLVALDYVLRLSRDQVRMPLPAWVYATMWAILLEVEFCVDQEIEGAEDIEPGSLVKESSVDRADLLNLAFSVCPKSISRRFPAACSRDIERWRDVFESLDGVLFLDHDWELEYLFADADPEVSAGIKQTVGIFPEYFTEVPPGDPASLQLARKRLGLVDQE